MWRKKTSKVHKTWEGDALGIVALSVDGQYKMTVRTDERVIATIRLGADLSGLKEGLILSAGTYEVELGPSNEGVQHKPNQEHFHQRNHQPPFAGRDRTVQKIQQQQPTISPSSRRTQTPFTGPVKKLKLAPLDFGTFTPLRPKFLAKPKQDQGTSTESGAIHPQLAAKLRPHQVEGVQFLYDSVLGTRHAHGRGCILADEMGLGKTLTSIALILQLIRQGQIRNALVVCPVTLVSNWKNEFKKWIPTGVGLGVMALDQKGLGNGSLSDPARVFFSDRQFKVHQVMIVGYERMRLIAAELSEANKQFDLVVCDEGHKLKTAGSKTAEAIASISDDKRVLLTGTPIQNNLTEFWALADFVNPGCFGSESVFTRKYVNKITNAFADPTSSSRNEPPEELTELTEIASEFMLRRTFSVIERYITVPKTELAVFCRPTPHQFETYKRLIIGGSELVAGRRDLIDQSASLQAITELKKAAGGDETNHGGKLRFLSELLRVLKNRTDEKVVVASGSTRILDICQDICTSEHLMWVRLDGQTPQEKRQSSIITFNKRPRAAASVFLLSTHSGGMGLNLIGGSRLVLMDCDWNPAIDAQVMARIHRDGQSKHCHIYRLFTTGTIDEKIFQRQLSKVGLSQNVLLEAGVETAIARPMFTREQLRDLFTLTTPPRCSLLDENLGADGLRGYEELTPLDDGADPILKEAMARSKNVSCVLRKL